MLPFLTPLDQAELRSINIPEPWNFGFQDRVRFGELDVLGHVNNAVYLKWFENYRINFFHHQIWPLIAERPTIVLRKVSVDFMAEIKLNESYVLTGRTTEIGRTSFTQNYCVWINGQMRTLGEAVIVTTENGTKIPVPSDLRDALKVIDDPKER